MFSLFHSSQGIYRNIIIYNLLKVRITTVVNSYVRVYLLISVPTRGNHQNPANNKMLCLAMITSEFGAELVKTERKLNFEFKIQNH